MKLLRELLESTEMDYNEFVKYFVSEFLPGVVDRFGHNDITAAREAFNDLQDHMGSNGDLADDWESWEGLPDEIENDMRAGKHGREHWFAASVGGGMN